MAEIGDKPEGHIPMNEREIVMILELSDRGKTWDEMGQAMNRDPRDLISFVTLALPDLAATISKRSIENR